MQMPIIFRRPAAQAHPRDGARRARSLRVSVGLKTLAVVVGLIFGATFLILPRNSGGWFWDIGGALGFLALAGMLFQMIPYPRTQTAKRHEILGYWVLGTAVAHAFWLLIGDGTLHLYLKPGAPLYMWLGVAGIAMLALLAVLARMPDRMRVHRRFATFRRVHRILAFVAVAGTLLHVLLSGFYLPTWPQTGLVVLLFLGMCLGRKIWMRLSEPPTASWQEYAIIGTASVAVFLLIRNLPI